MNRLATILCCFWLLLAISAPAGAREWWAGDDGETAVEGWGYVKDSILAAHFMGIDLYPDEAGATNSLRARLGVDTYHKKFKFGFELELFADTRFLGFAGTDRTIFGTTATRPRLVEVPSWENSHATLGLNVDRLYFRWSAGPVDITVGRQAISWGSAWFWKPTDRFAPFSPTDIDPDVKRGVDAIRLEAYATDTTSIDVIASFEHHSDDDELPIWTNAGVRVRTNVKRYDLAVSLARFQNSAEGNWMVGFEFTGELPKKIGFRGEAALNVMEESREVDIEAVVGIDYRFQTRTTLAAEFMFNGYGAASRSDYALFLEPTGRGERLARGEAFNMGRYYLGVAVQQEVSPLLNLSFSMIANLADPSAMFMAGLSWSVTQDVRLSAGLMIPVGGRPEMMESKVPAIESEYGMMPAVGYTVIKFSY